MKDLTDRITDLSPAKRELLELKLARQGAFASDPQRIQRKTNGGPAPLSFAQQRLWFLSQLDLENPSYNQPKAVALTGALDTVALQRALDHIVERHEVLRTTLALVDGNPAQTVGENCSVELPVIDLSDTAAVDRGREVQRIIQETTRRPFDLSKDLMLRAALIRLDRDDHVLVLVTHHVASDGWSAGVLFRELAVLYEAFCTGKASPLPELPIQYADFAVWQRQWLQGEVLESQLSYWKKQLAEVPMLKLPTDRARPSVQSFRGARQTLALPESLSNRLKVFSRKEGVTLFMTLLAAFQTLLHRYTGQEDIVVGSPIANRTRTELECLIGFFVNTLVLRTDLSGNPSFRELMARVRNVALDAYEHQDLPFEKLVEELHPDRNLSHSPLFQVMFVFQNVPRSALELPGLRVSSVKVDSGTVKFDLTLSMVEAADSLTASMTYNTYLFEDATITRMLGHFQTLLQGIVANPEQRLSDLPILTEAERHQLLVEWNETNKAYPKDKCIHQLFEAQVERTPDAIAVVFADQQLTYRELNGRANQLARYLRNRGVGPDVLVGICVERSLEMVVGLLGILKAGGAYVPLDPSYPHERLDFMLQDTQAPVLLTQQRLMESLPKHGAKILCLDTDWEVISQERETNLPTQGTADNLAYVIYTSGSTGKPKGSLITHCNVTRLFQATHSWVHFDQNDVWTLFHSYAFDFSVWEMWGALLYGGRLVVVPYWVSRSPETFYDLLRKERVTILNQTPSAFTQLVQIEQSSVNPYELALRLVIFGGEALDLHSLKPWFDCHGDRYPQLVNMYGITETTVHVTYRPLTAADVSESSASLIGVPIPDLELYVLDQNQNPVPIGVPGELYVGGAGLGRGYLNRPELTAERFIPNPFRHGTGERLYRSGDLARFLSNRDIEYLGRIDTQIKIRGFRIELGEIEAMLSLHPAVKQAVVVPREDTPGDKRLAAYVVPKQESVPTAYDLRGFLKEKLPDYMVPSAFVQLESFPLTPNGKVDRKALPAPDQNRPEMEDGYVAPRTPVEELLAEIWAAVLKLDKIGIHDNFFDLGGHSLLATQVVSRIREALRVELPLRLLFEKPTVIGLAEQIEKARRKKQGAQTLPLLAVSRKGSLPLSFAQQRLWFLDQLEPGSTVYNVPGALYISGPLDVAALERTLNEVARRHEALRTVFSTTSGQPVQTISPSLTLPLTVVDLSDLSENEREAEVRRRALEESQTHFDLTRGPLARVTLLRLGRQDHVLFLTMHHIVCDGWSMAILFHELSALYEAFTEGKPSPLNELTIQYVDFASWQRNWLQGEVLEKQLSYWKTKLERAPALQLPTDRPRPPVRSHRGGKRSFVLDKNVTDALRVLSRQENVTLFMTLLAAFQSLLHRYTAQDDIVVGSAIAGRTRPEIEGLIGFFVNTLVLPNDFSGNPTFNEVLARVRQVCLDGYTHQDLPFEKLVEELHPDRSLSQNPLFQVMFVLQNAPAEALRFGDLAITPLEVNTEHAKFDLTLLMREEEEGLRAVLNYSADLFDGATIDRMAGHFQRLLEGIAAHPEQRVSDLPILTEAERRQLLVEWNDTKRDYPRDKCIHQLFEEQVERTPDAVALAFDDQQLTYRELNLRANQLAHYLRKLGVGPEVLVGICTGRSLEMIVGLLGILKAGGAYVPLDPEYPKERLAFMLEDTQLSTLLTLQRLVDRLPDRRAEAVCLDTQWEAIAEESEENPAGAGTADNLAYVIYTSGSTGRPKGVMIPHRAIGNHMSWMQNEFPLMAEDRVIQKTPFSFDASVWEFFAPLLAGAQLIMAPPGAHQDSSCLVRLIGEQRVTVLQLVPSLLQVFLEEKEIESCRWLKRVFCGGEALSPDLVERFHERMGAELCNLYGPTEASIDATFWMCPRGDARRFVPIGRPIANTQIYVLDAHLEPVPIGIPGELCIGGDGLARGYLNRPELTAEKFIPDPFNDDPTARLYKSGDLARYLPDGNIEFLGRIDHQVKIRGFRIELGEIESTLSAHGSVREAVVLAREDETGKRLVGYVVPKSGQTGAAGDLRNFLKAKLPDYMIPSAFVLLDKLPLMPTGKVDRKALPAPDQNRPEMEDSYVAPRTPVEELLAEIWAAVLKLDKIGIHDNFFSLGGHSLLATQVVSRIREALRVELPLRLLFEKPTVIGLAEQIGEARRKDQGVEAVPIRKVPRDGELPLSYAQQRLWFLDRLEPESTIYNVPATLRISGSLNLAALESSINEVVRRHEALRTIFSAKDGEPRQTILPPPSLPLTVVDLRKLDDHEREAEVRRHAREASRTIFDLARGPLLRTKILRLGPEDHVLLLTMHHIVSDGWSTGILFRELSALYEAFTQGKPSPLAELTIQYVDFASWQRNWLQGEVLEKQLSYWKTKLERAPALQLPTDRPRPPVRSHRGGKRSFVLDKNVTDSLRVLSRQENVTLFMTLLAAFQSLLHRYTAQDDIVVGSPIAGRTRPEIEGLIGFFVNTLVLRNDFSGNPTFKELVARVRQVCLDAYTHQDVPFEKLVEELHPERSLSQNPLFQVMFVLQNAPAEALRFGDLAITPLEVNTEHAKFDLTLSMREEEDGLQAVLNYSADLFDGTTIDRMAGHFQRLLEGIAAHPEQRVSDLPILTEAERRQLLVEWNDTATEYPGEKCIHEVFEERVKSNPEAVAIIYDDRQLTYRELNLRANQVARYLRRLGIGREELVGICLDRSLEMISGLLGILKAGGAYVPLDPEYPNERLKFMLEDIRAKVVLTQERLVDRFPDFRGRVVCLDRDWEEIAQQPAENLENEAAPSSLAYVIYTSGSTGKPKGVEVPHRSVVRLLFGVDYAQLDASRTLVHLAPTSFDASTFEIWGALLHGAKCVLAPQGFSSPADLRDLLHRHQATTLWLTASLFNLVIDQLPEALSQVRELLIGGEALSVPHVRRALSLLPSTQIINGYGPTESATFTCCYRIPAKLDDALTSIPIGRPIGNTEVYILDGRLNPAPIGSSGELYIGGAGLARGYLNASELTNERFIPNPFSAEPGDRIYKTGDLARYLPDGNIEFLGRLDHQVKIRGFRIELGEIESVLRRHPGIRETVVAVRQDGDWEKQLVAYIAPKDDAPTTHDLRRFLRQKLPGYMIPSAFVYLPALPLAANGKTDYGALPEATGHGTRDHNEYAAPRDETERVLCRVWSEVLGVDRVGLDDDFFAIGGHSLLAAKLFARLDESFGRSLPLGVLFRAPTVRLLAERYRSIPEPKARLVIVPLWTAGTLPPIFAIPGVFGNVICFAELSRELGSDQPFYGLQSVGLDGAEAPLDSIEKMGTLYVQELRSVQAHGPYAIIGACFGATVAYEMARQLLDAGEEVGFLGLLDPTRREGSIAGKRPATTPRIFKRVAALAALVAERLILYREEMQRLGAKDRAKYLASKFHLLLGWIKNTNALKGAERELNQIEVYRSNLVALDGYRREVLDGRLKAFEIFETTRPGKSGVQKKIDWRLFWKGHIKRHHVPGRDSGDMLTGKNAQAVAVLLAERLRAAFKETGR